MSKHGRDRGARSAARLRGGRMSGAVLHFCAARYGRGVLLARALRGTERGGWLGLFVAFELYAGGERLADGGAEGDVVVAEGVVGDGVEFLKVDLAVGGKDTVIDG